MCQSRKIDKQTVEVHNWLGCEQSNVKLRCLRYFRKVEREPIVFTGDVLTNGSAGKNKTRIQCAAFNPQAAAKVAFCKAFNTHLL